MGSVEKTTEIDQLPDGYFDVAFTESGPNINTALMRKLTKDAYFLQETGGKFGSYQLHEILGRKPYTYYAYSDEYNDFVVQPFQLDKRACLASSYSTYPMLPERPCCAKYRFKATVPRPFSISANGWHLPSS